MPPPSQASAALDPGIGQVLPCLGTRVPHFPHTQYSSSRVWTGNCSKFFPMAGRAKEWVCIIETSEGAGSACGRKSSQQRDI